ncbi:MAG: hypothetical protein V4475_01755 [Pseudomonadota bacterium]
MSWPAFWIAVVTIGAALCVFVHVRSIGRDPGKCNECGNPSDRDLCDECHQLSVW